MILYKIKVVAASKILLDEYFGGMDLNLVWLGFILEIMLVANIKPFITEFVGVGIILVQLHMIFSVIVLMSYKLEEKYVFLFAYLSRVAFMFWDLYASHIYSLPNSGSDSESYYKQAVYFSENINLLSSNQVELYSKIIGSVFYLTGPERIIGQYINVLLGLSIVFIVYKLLLILEVDKQIAKIILLIASFFPNALIMSAIFLREIFPTFLLAASLYFFIKWLKYQRLPHAILSLGALGIASIFHSGVIGVALGYFFGFLFYDKTQNKLRFSTKSITSFVLIVAVVVISLTYFDDVIFGKFRNVEEIGDIYSKANQRLGGSAYLTSITINNPIQLVIFGPIKTFYFFTSPLPLNWRGFMDIFTFMTDSMLYLMTIVYTVKNRKLFGDKKVLIVCLIWMLVGAGLIFGIGVSNAGTAVRHRQKLMAIFLVLLGVVLDEKKKSLTKSDEQF